MTDASFSAAGYADLFEDNPLENLFQRKKPSHL